VNVTPSNNPQRPGAGHASEAAASGRSEPTTSRSSAGVPARGDGVELSGEARTLLRLRGRLDGLPTAGSEERVERLRAAIEAGTYRVSGERIADAMLRDPGVASVLLAASRG
jgi:negative regulator of flagellin synthesis FlgM